MLPFMDDHHKQDGQAFRYTEGRRNNGYIFQAIHHQHTHDRVGKHLSQIEDRLGSPFMENQKGGKADQGCDHR